MNADKWAKAAAVRLKREIAAGIDDLDNGRQQTYADKTLLRLAQEIGRAGRVRLKRRRASIV